MCSWETHIFAYFTIFYWNNVARHLWSNLQTWQPALYILSYFPGIKYLNGLNDFNSLNNLSAVASMTSTASFHQKTFILK